MEREVRKVQLVGGHSLSVTIPKRWASILGLTQGNAVEMLFDGSSIVVKPLKKAPESGQVNIFVDLADGLDVALLKVVSAYVEGVTNVRVKASYSDMTKLGELLENSVAPLYIHANPASTIHEIILQDPPLSVDQVLSKLIGLTIRILKGGAELETLKDFNRTYNALLRVSKKEILTGSRDPLSVLDCVQLAELLRHLVEIVGLINSFGKEFEVIEFLEEILNSFRTVNVDVALRVVSSCKKYLENTEEPVLRVLAYIVMRIAELVLRRCVRDKACRCRYFYPKI